MPARHLLLVGLAVVVLACAGDSAPSLATTRDSAGIRIVENPPPDSTTAVIRLSDTPALVLGSLDGPEGEQFGSVVAAFRTDHGDLLMVDGRNFTIHRFDSTGQPLGTFGRRGQGPGEFQHVGAAFPGRAGGLCVHDVRGRALTCFDADRNPRRYPLGRPEQVRGTDGTLRPAGLGVLSALGGHHFLGIGSIARGAERSLLHVDSSIVWLIDTTGAVRQIHQGFRKEAWEYFYDDRGSFWFGDRPYCRVGSFVAGDSSWFHSDGSEFRVQERMADGRLHRLIVVSRARAPVSNSDRERLLDWLVAVESDPAHRQITRDALAWVEWPTHKPAYDALRRDNAGQVWARHFPDGEAIADWDIFDQAGRLVAVGRIPSALDVQQIGPDWLLALSKGDLDEPLVFLYRLSR